MSDKDPGQEPATTEGQEPAATTTEAPGTEQDSPRKYDQAYVDSLRKEAGRYRSEAKAAQAKAEEYENAQKSELEKITDQLGKTEKARTEAESRLLRYEVAAEKGLTGPLVDLLSGSSKEELEQKADLILENISSKPEEPKVETFDGGPRAPAEEPKDPVEAHNGFLMGLFGTKPQ
jgi:hypothetical protein